MQCESPCETGAGKARQERRQTRACTRKLPDDGEACREEQWELEERDLPENPHRHVRATDTWRSEQDEKYRRRAGARTDRERLRFEQDTVERPGERNSGQRQQLEQVALIEDESFVPGHT